MVSASAPASGCLSDQPIKDPGLRMLMDSCHVEELSADGREDFKLRFEYEPRHIKEKYICANDDKDKFIKGYLEWYDPEEIDHEVLWFNLFEYDAVKCVAAVLDGETEGLLELPPGALIPGGEFSCTPLHMAADLGAHGLAKLFLDRRGSDAANVRDSDNQLPLNLSLEMREPWRLPQNSIYFSLVLLCWPDRVHHLETLRVLANHTKGVELEFIKYAMEGSIQAVAKLLLAAPERVIPLGGFDSLRKDIIKKIALLLVEDVRSALIFGTDFLTQKRMFLEATLALLEIYDKVGYQFSAYLRIFEEDWAINDDIRLLFESSGISVDYSDKFLSAIPYRSLSELFINQRIISPTPEPKHEGGVRDGAITGPEGPYNPKCFNDSTPCNGTSPLKLALEALCLHRCLSDWMPTKSIFKLIYIFCLPELKEPLKTIELLASDISVVQKIGSLCVQEEKLVELSALLLVSWDMLVFPGPKGEIGSSFIGTHILGELQRTLNLESKLVCTRDDNQLQQVRRKKGGLLFALSMLEIFKTARTTLQDYRLSLEVKQDIANFQVAADVSNLLRSLGFCLKIDDVDVNDIKCLLREMDSEPSDVASAGEKEEAHFVKPHILPDPSNDNQINDDGFEGQKVYLPMYHGGLYAMAPRSFRSMQIPKRKALNLDTSIIYSQTRLSGINNLARPSSSSMFSAVRSWTKLASAAKRWLRYI